MYRLLQLVLVALSSLFALTSPVLAQTYCQSSYGRGVCPSCSQIGRTYTKVGGLYCTVCNAFCNVSYRASSGVEEYVVVQAPTEPVFVLRVPKSVLHSLLQVNPEAAMLLAVLDFRSTTVDALPPTRGDGGSDRAMSAQAVLGFLQGEQDSARLREVTAPLPASAVQSKVTWEFEKSSSRLGQLRIAHRFLNDRDEVVSQPYRDLSISLRWVAASTGSGHWIAHGWREQP